jgi:hypothetical protein
LLVIMVRFMSFTCPRPAWSIIGSESSIRASMANSRCPLPSYKELWLRQTGKDLTLDIRPEYQDISGPCYTQLQLSQTPKIQGLTPRHIQTASDVKVCASIVPKELSYPCSNSAYVGFRIPNYRVTLPPLIMRALKRHHGCPKVISPTHLHPSPYARARGQCRPYRHPLGPAQNGNGADHGHGGDRPDLR